MSEPARRSRCWPRRVVLAGAAALVACALALPLWATRMEAPQYRGEEALHVQVYAGRVDGDIREIETLNSYVGVHLPLDTPELRASRFVLGALALAALVAALLPAGATRRGAGVVLALLVMTGLGASVLLQYRLYEMGHVRTHSIMARIDDFTPPLVGTRKVANFTVTMTLGAGAWCYLGAIVMAAAGAVIGRRRRTAIEPLAKQGETPSGPPRGGLRERSRLRSEPSAAPGA